jgi:hypothetical protein
MSDFEQDRLGDDEDIEHRPAANEKLHPMVWGLGVKKALKHECICWP